MTSMTRLSLIAGVLLVIIGLAGYLGTDRISMTALIPAAFGVPIIGLGLMARKEHLRKHAMHAAVLLALVGIMGTASGVAKLVSGQVELRFILQAVMLVICVIYTALAVKSFIDVRRAREGKGLN